MACAACWQQRQAVYNAFWRGNPVGVVRAVGRGVTIATDKYVRGIDVNRKHAPMSLLSASRRAPR